MSLHTFRQYVQRARRVKAEQALGEKGKAVRASKAQSRDILGDAPTRNPADARGADATGSVAHEAQRVDTPAAPISQTVAKPPTQKGKTAAEVLGHRFNEDV